MVIRKGGKWGIALFKRKTRDYFNHILSRRRDSYCQVIPIFILIWSLKILQDFQSIKVFSGSSLKILESLGDYSWVRGSCNELDYITCGILNAGSVEIFEKIRRACLLLYDHWSSWVGYNDALISIIWAMPTSYGWYKILSFSMEEAKKNMYAFSTTTYTGFQCTVSEETSEKFKGMLLLLKYLLVPFPPICRCTVSIFTVTDIILLLLNWCCFLTHRRPTWCFVGLAWFIYWR